MPITEFRGSYAFLSNFYEVRIGYEGVSYPTAEHAYQASKTLDPALRRKIAAAATPADAKRMGREVPLRPHWNLLRIPIMHDILRLKFRPETMLASKLINTLDEDLVEENNWGDKFWGTVNGEGKNTLGRLLMAVRDQLLFGQAGGDA